MIVAHLCISFIVVVVECDMLVLTTLMHSVYFRLDSRTLITVIVTCVGHMLSVIYPTLHCPYLVLYHLV